MSTATTTLQEELLRTLRRLESKYDDHARRTIIKKESVSRAQYMNGEPLFDQSATHAIVEQYFGNGTHDIQALLRRLNGEIHRVGFSKGLAVAYVYSEDHHGMIFALMRIAQR